MTPEFLEQQLQDLLLQAAPPYSTSEVRSVCAALIRCAMMHCVTMSDTLAHEGRAKWTDAAAIRATEHFAATLHAELDALV